MLSNNLSGTDFKLESLQFFGTSWLPYGLILDWPVFIPGIQRMKWGLSQNFPEVGT